MLLEIIDWIKVMDVVAKTTKRQKKAIGEEIGIAGSAIGALSGTTKQPELRHSEGEYLLGLYRSVTDTPVPKLKKSKQVRCPSCSILRERSDIMRMNVQKFRCTSCVDRAKNKAGGL